MANISNINGLLINAATASLATTASYATIAQNVLGSITSASYAATASLLLGSVVSASYAATASFVIGGGSTSPGGSTTQIQYNNAGAFGGVPVLTYDGTTLRVTGSLSGSLTGNLIGTSSWATNAVTASRILTQTDSTNASYFLAFVDANNATPSVETLLTATGIIVNPAQRSLNIQNAITGGVFLGPLTGSVFGTASWATNALTASFLPLGTYSITSSWAQSASNAINAQTASFLPLGTYAITSSWAVSASQAITASFAVSASWAPSSGGGGTPGGVVNEVQYNNGAGGFAGAANVEISTAGNLLLVATTDPATPAAGTLEMYSKTIAGRTLPKIKGPSGLDYVIQPALFQNANYMWTQNNTANGVWMSTIGTGVPTAGFLTIQPTTGGGGTNYTIQKRARYVSAATTANQIIGVRNTEATFFRGSVAGQGGFFFYARFGFDTWTNGGRMFVGMATATTVITAEPSALNNTVGFCVDSGDAGAISFLTRTTATGTKQPTGLTVSTGKGYDVFIFNAPNSGTFSYRIVDLNTGTEYSNSATLTPPTAGTGLTANVLSSNAALTAANAIQMGVVKIYIETDY